MSTGTFDIPAPEDSEVRDAAATIASAWASAGTFGSAWAPAEAQTDDVTHVLFSWGQRQPASTTFATLQEVSSSVENYNFKTAPTLKKGDPNDRLYRYIRQQMVDYSKRAQANPDSSGPKEGGAAPQT